MNNNLTKADKDRKRIAQVETPDLYTQYRPVRRGGSLLKPMQIQGVEKDDSRN